MPEQSHNPEALDNSQRFAGWLTYGDGDPYTNEFISAGLARGDVSDNVEAVIEVSQTIDGEV